MESSPLTAPTTLDYTWEFHIVRPVQYSSPPATRLGRTAAAESRSTRNLKLCIRPIGHHSYSLNRPSPAEFGLSLLPAVARKSHSDDFYIRPRSEPQFHRPRR